MNVALRTTLKAAAPAAAARTAASILPTATRAATARFMATVAEELDTLSEVAARCIRLEDQYGAHNYHPLPVVLKEGKGK